MKCFGFTLYFLFLIQLASGQSTFTANEAVDYARERSVNVANSRLEQQRSGIEVERLQRRWLPNFSASTNIRYNPILQTTLLPAAISGGSTGELIEVQFGTSFSSSIGLTVNQKIFDPSFRLERELIGLGKKKAARDEAYEYALVGIKVTAAYFQALLNQEIYQNSQSLLGGLAQLREDVRIRVENEQESLSLLHSINLQYRQQQHKIRVDSLNWLASLANLKLEMNFPFEEELELTDSLVLMFEDLVIVTVDDNYDMQQYNFQLEESHNASSRLQRSKLPTIEAEGYIGGQFFSQSPDLYNFKRWYGLSYIGLTANLPLYDGNDKRYGEQIETLKREQVRNQMQAYRIEQGNKAFRASLQLESARAQALLAEEAIETAAQNLELARFNYLNEVTGFQPVFEAQQALANSREQLINAKASYIQAVLEARLLDL